ncbi:hypothetical protein KSS87_008613 [Heliosperma pusillum]|nr:hypothetical protein KSS87_008613 [Heliosperma pusillum]
MLYPYGQHFWTGTPVTAPCRIPPRSTAQGQQQGTAAGLKFATVYVDSEEQLPTTRKFIAAFHISPPKASGPYGSQSPKTYAMILRPDESIKEVIVRHGAIVDAIGFVVADKCGTTSTKKFGGDGGTESKHSSSDNNVATLVIHTNLNPTGYGPYGRAELVQNRQNFSSDSGSVAGFFGRHSNYLESVGVYLSARAYSKAYAESGPIGPIDWNVVEVKLNLSEHKVMYHDDILGGKVEATVYGNGDAGVVCSETSSPCV